MSLKVEDFKSEMTIQVTFSLKGLQELNRYFRFRSKTPFSSFQELSTLGSDQAIASRFKALSIQKP